MRISLIISTYSSPDWLEHVIRGYAHKESTESSQAIRAKTLAQRSR